MTIFGNFSIYGIHL